MAVMSWWRDVVTVWRAPLVEERGTQVRDWASAEPHTVGGCSVQQLSPGSTDWGTGEQGRTVRAEIYMGPDADVESNDRIEFGGHMYAIEGAPMDMYGVTGRIAHKHAVLVDWEG